MATKIESKKVTVNASGQDLYDYVIDLNNFEQLLPEGRVKNFTSDGDSCHFEISGVAKLGLKIKETFPPNKVILESVGAPFPFTLNIFLNELEQGKTEAFQISDLDVNPFMKMMVQKPLKNLFDHIADQLVVQFENSAI